MDVWRIAQDDVAATICAQGAELQSLEHLAAGELLWQAGPIWPSHAPNLFPIVGQLRADTLHVNGVAYHLPRHGFARRRRFAWTAYDAQSCELELVDDEATRDIFPFAFALRIGFALMSQTLRVTYTLTNPGRTMLPASIGAHPAFRWPLAAGLDKSAHRLEFEHPEPLPIRRLRDGLLRPEPYATPIVGNTLALVEALFVNDAIILDHPTSHGVRYSAPQSVAIMVHWTGFAQLGIWSKSPGDFVCIEPWYGYASPEGFDGPFEEKPGLLLIEPGASQTLTMDIRVEF